jgi:hypothetical protein
MGIGNFDYVANDDTGPVTINIKENDYTEIGTVDIIIELMAT